MTLPPYTTRDLVEERLSLIFLEGTPHRLYCIRRLAASTVFAALYIGAIEDSGIFFGPAHVYRMTVEQAADQRQEARIRYATTATGQSTEGTRWYADNTREPIRDETLRDGLVSIGAVLQRPDVATTSSHPRYALRTDFANLFDPTLRGSALEHAIASYQATHLSVGARARVSIVRAGAAGSRSTLSVAFPNGETRQLDPGPSSIIAKSVVEVFAPRFLGKPAVLWLSQSGNKVVLQDQRLAQSLGLNIEADRNLPDLILADLEPSEPLIIFVEVVATDGAVTANRQAALLALTESAGYKRQQIAFVTAYLDRESRGFKKTADRLAWESFAWFASEPDSILIMREGATRKLSLAALMA